MLRSLVALSLLSLAAPCFAAASLDQYHDPLIWPGSDGSFIGRWGQAAQSFTVGYTGSLSYLDLLVVRSDLMEAPLLVDIRSTLNGKPGGSLSHVSVAAVDVPRSRGWLRVDIPDIEVEQGQQLAISLDAEVTGDYRFYRWIFPAMDHVRDTPPEKYLGGEFWLDEGSGWFPAFGDADDHAFRTYVDRPVDLDLNGAVNGEDLALMLDDFDGARFLRWQEFYSVPVAVGVPEPSGWILGLLALVGVVNIHQCVRRGVGW